MKGDHKSKRSRAKTLTIITWVTITLLTYLPPLLNPVNFGLGIFLLIAYPIVLTLNIFLLIWLFYKESYVKAIMVITLVAVGWPLHSKLVNFHSPALEPLQTDLKIATFNANYGYGFNSLSNKGNRGALAKMLGKHKKPDILCLQEYATEIQDWLESHLPYTNTVNNYPYRTAIFTDHEVTNHGFFSFENHENSAVWADIIIPDFGTVRTYNIHLQSNQVTDQSRKIQERGLEFDDETFRTLTEILGNYQNAAAKRVAQVDEILQHAKETPYPVILAGDLNDVPISYIYRKVAKDRQDTFTKKGSGLGLTYTGPVPFLRIDFIFPDTDFNVIRHDLPEGDFSDHKPVVAWLRKK